MSVFENGPIYSPLPNLPPSAQISPEKKDIKGFLYGFSTHRTEHGDVFVFHKSDLGSWDSIGYVSPKNVISRKYVTARAFFGAQEVGSASFCPYAVCDGGLKHPSIWCSSHTGVDPAWRRRHVASSIYAHMRDFGYKLSPAPVLSYEAQSMWQAFDANFSFDTRSRKNQINYALPVQALNIPDMKTEADRTVALYTPEHLSLIQWVRSHIESAPPGSRIHELKKISNEIFTDPNDALTSIVIDHDLYKSMGWIKFAVTIRQRSLRNEYRSMAVLLTSPKIYSFYKSMDKEFHKQSQILHKDHKSFLSQKANEYMEDFETWMGFSIKNIETP